MHAQPHAPSPYVLASATPGWPPHSRAIAPRPGNLPVPAPGERHTQWKRTYAHMYMRSTHVLLAHFSAHYEVEPHHQVKGKAQHHEAVARQRRPRPPDQLRTATRRGRGRAKGLVRPERAGAQTCARARAHGGAPTPAGRALGPHREHGSGLAHASLQSERRLPGHPPRAIAASPARNRRQSRPRAATAPPPSSRPPGARTATRPAATPSSWPAGARTRRRRRPWTRCRQPWTRAA